MISYQRMLLTFLAVIGAAAAAAAAASASAGIFVLKLSLIILILIIFVFFLLAAASSSASSSASASAPAATGNVSTKTMPMSPRSRGSLHLADLELESEKAEFMSIWEKRKQIVKEKRESEVALNDCVLEGMQNDYIDDRFLICPQTTNAMIITTLSSSGRDRFQLSVSKEFSEDECMSLSVVDVAHESMPTRYEIVA